MPKVTPSARLVLCLLLAAVVILPGTARAAAPAGSAKGPQKVAVMAVRTTGIDKGVGSTLTEILTSEVATVSHLQVIGASDIKSLLGFQAQKQMLGCTDDAACLAQIGGALGVDLLVSAQVGKVGGTYVVSVKLLRIDQSKVEGRTYETVKGALDQVIGRLKAAVRTVFGQAGYGKKARVAALGGQASAPPQLGTEMMPETPGGPSPAWHVPGWSWGLWAGGVALLAGGGVMGLQANAAYAAVYPTPRLSPNTITTSANDGTQKSASSGAQAQLLANVGFGLGAAALVAGTAVLFLDHGGSDGAPTVMPMAGGGTYGAMATVRF